MIGLEIAIKGVGKTSPIEVQMSVCVLFILCLFSSIIFVFNKIFAWVSTKYDKANPFEKAWILTITRGQVERRSTKKD
jgi:hypothetical protein